MLLRVEIPALIFSNRATAAAPAPAPSPAPTPAPVARSCRFNIRKDFVTCVVLSDGTGTCTDRAPTTKREVPPEDGDGETVLQTTVSADASRTSITFIRDRGAFDEDDFDLGSVRFFCHTVHAHAHAHAHFCAELGPWVAQKQTKRCMLKYMLGQRKRV